LVRLEVHDTGPGLTADVQQRLFRAFTQGDESITRRFGGTGLGLSICRELAELMGGHVGVQSQLGYGSCFWAELSLAAVATAVATAAEAATATATATAEADSAEPADVQMQPTPFSAESLNVPASPYMPTPTPASGIASAAARAQLPIHAEPRSSLRERRVLIVEDNAVNMLIAVAMMESWGLQVAQAQDGQQALALVQRLFDEGKSFDAVLMDVQMPQMSGHEVTRALRRTQAGAHLPIIALTAAALASERSAALDAGMSEFLTKPIDAARLLASLERWVLPVAR
jgi:CheY-like chemotaxis protein